MRSTKFKAMQHIAEYIFIFVFVLLYSMNCFSQTNISGGNVSGNWTVAESPYQVNGEITVVDGTTLTIDPGVTVEFQGHYKFIVNGVLLAEGTETDSIFFTVNDTTGFYDIETTNGGWHGIRFENNTSVDSSKLVYCKIQFGKATNGDDQTTTDDDCGGAIFVDHFSNLRIEHCLIDQNKAASAGAGIYVDVAEIIVRNNTITNNESGFSAGGIGCDGNNMEWDYMIEISNNTSNNNQAAMGGGIRATYTHALIQDNIIDSNSGTMGGGLYVDYSSVIIERNKIRNNSSYDGGGIHFSSAWSIDFNTNLVANNTADYGAGIRNQTGALSSVNNTIVNNSSHGIYGDFNSTNCIIYNNGADIYGTNTLNYCAVEGGYAGTGNMDIDPGFVNPSAGIGIQPDALDADYSLTTTSDLVNAGIADTTGLGLSQTDLAGNERVYSGYIDIGAYELNERAEKEGNYATDLTWKGDTVDIIGHIYIEDASQLTINPGTVLQFMGHYKMDVQGSLIADGTETDSIIFTYHDTTGFHNTDVSDGSWLGLRFNNTPATNDSSIFEFCRIEFSKALDGLTELDSLGGAFGIDGFSKIRIDSSLIRNNYSYYAGGAIYVADAAPKILHSFIMHNETSGSAGGIFLSNAFAKIKGNAIVYNEATNSGGIGCYDNAEAEIIGNLISNNNGGLNCGGLHVSQGSSPAIENNIICNNWAQQAGGLYIADNSHPTLTNNTIVNNDTDEGNGGGLYCTQNSSPGFRNTIIYGNAASNGSQVYIDGDESDPSFTYCNIEEGLAGFGLGGGAVYEGTYENNYDFSPGFVSPTAAAGIDYDGFTADWSLLTSSSCLNAGDPNTFGLPDYDVDGNDRVYSGRVDLGAYELQQVKEACGTITEDAFWTGDTVKITCETTVDAGVILTIDPGTVVEFTGYYKLIVNGVILAEGNQTDSIIFTTNDPVTGYHGIRFESNASTDSSKFSYCKFEYGKATGSYPDELGGAIYSNAFDLILIENCSFFNNSATGGGAIYLEFGASPVIKNSKFINNNGGNYYGGAISCSTGSSIIVNNVFANNSADKGGAVSINSNITFNNNTIVNNNSATYGGGIHFAGTCTMDIKNCIIYGNTSATGNQIFFMDNTADPNFVNSDIEGGLGAFGTYTAVTYDGTLTNCIDADPVFTDPNAGVGNQTDAWSSDWTLQGTSPCINTGLADTTGLNLPTKDILGNPRVINNIIDMGAYESKVVPACGNISSNTNWDADTVKVNCDITIDDSYALTIDPGTVVEFQGYYSLTVNGTLLAEGTNADSITFSVADTTGFADTSIVDGGWAGIIFNNVAATNDSSKFDYCTFMFGKAPEASGATNGGAFKIVNSPKISITNSLFKNNMASGMYASGGAIDIQNTDNIQIANCTFVENIAKGPYFGGGGAINIATSSPNIYNGKFFNNVADSSSGGAIYILDNASPHLANNLFANNYARFGGAMLFATNASPAIYNNTIAYNNAKFGGGINCYENSDPLIKNTILYANTDSAGGAQVFIFDNASSPDFAYNNIQGGEAGFDMPDTVSYAGNYTDNLDANPLFTSPSAGSGLDYNGQEADWKLQEDNPCINTGIPDTTGLNIPPVDLAGETRIFNDVRIDIGAYEYRNNHPEINAQTFDVDENSGNTTLVGTCAATDVDGDNFSFSIVSGNTNNAFAIDNDGNITVNNSVELDYENVAGQQFELTIQIDDDGVGTLYDQAVITINLLDVNDAPVMNADAFTIDENLTNGSIVGTVTGTDEDVPAQHLTYSIIGGTYAANFSIDASSGEITVADSTALNYEIHSSIDIAVQVQDDGAGNLTDNNTITINLNDINDYPVIANQQFAVNEQSDVGTSIGTVVAIDTDSPAQNLAYAIVSGNENTAFSIVSTTGEIQINNKDSVDYELAASQVIIVEVADDGAGSLSSTAEITVNINNINDNAPVFNDTIVSHSEFAGENAMIVEFMTTDADELEDLSYSFVSGNENDIFYLQNGNWNRLYFSSNGYQNYLNYEEYPSFDLVIAVSDGDSITEANVTINIQDENEYPEIDVFEFNLDENASIGTLVGTISGTDPDIGQNLYYFIKGGTFNNITPFAIDSVTGEITVIDSTILNYEGFFPTLNLTIEVHDDGTPGLSINNSLIISLNDVNEAPIVDPQSYSMYENATPNMTVATINYKHDDAGQSVNFEITEGNEDGLFVIDASSGQISTANTDSLDYETNPVIELVVEVTDNSPGQLSDTALITFNVQDINEPPVISDYTFTIDENTPYATVIGTVEAIDAENDPVTYYFVTNNMYPPFNVKSANGEIFVSTSDSIDFEYRSQFVLTLAAKDNNYNETYSIVTININDVNEAPIVEQEVFYIDENSPENAVVDTVGVITDAGETLTFSITDGNTYDIFNINPVTGEIFVSNADTLNYEFINYFELTVRATDDSPENYWGENVQIIYVQNVNEAPIINPQKIYYLKDPNFDPYVGTVTATDEDQDLLFYSIESGNIDNAFTIHEEMGEIYVENPEAINPNVTPTYELIVKVEDYALSDTALITIQLTPNGISHLDISEIVNLFPNPVKDKLHFDFANIRSSVKIEILDLKDQIMIAKEVNSNTKIEVSALASGLYIIRITDAGKYYYGKIVKE